MKSRTSSLLVAITLSLGLATPGFAIRFLEAGPQSLTGTLVFSGGNPSGCLIPPGKGLGIAPRRAARRYSLVLSAGSRSEQFLSIEFPMGNQEMPTFLREKAVRRRPKFNRYDGVASITLEGNLVGSMGQGFTFMVANAPGGGGGPDYSDERTIENSLQRWRFLAAEADPTGKASLAMTRLERSGMLRKMIELVLEVSREE